MCVIHAQYGRIKNQLTLNITCSKMAASDTWVWQQRDIVAEVLVRVSNEDDLLSFLLTCKEVAEVWRSDVVLRARWLLARSPSPNSALKVAALANRTELLQCLMKLKPYEQEDLDVCVIMAADRGHITMIEYLCDVKGAVANTRDDLALRASVLNGHVDVVEVLLKKYGADPRCGDGIAIKVAISRGRRDMSGLLLDSIVDTSGFDLTTFVRMASRNGHLNLIEMFVDRYDVDVLDESTLIPSVDGGHSEIIRLLLTRAHQQYPDGCERARDVYRLGDVALAIAVDRGHTDIFDYLCDRYGSNSDLRGLLMVAAQKKHHDIVRLFNNKYGKHTYTDFSYMWSSIKRMLPTIL